MVPDFLTIAEAARLIQQRELSPVELVDSRLARIAKLDPPARAFLRRVRAEADREPRIAGGRLSQSGR